MRPKRIVLGSLYLLILVAGSPGCAVLPWSRPMSVLVRDAETKQPLAGAELALSYPLAKGPAAPSGVSGTTNQEGIVWLHAVPSGDASILLEAKAQGYLPEWKTLAADEVRKIAPAHFFEKVENRPGSYVLELYAAPRPTIELVLPAGFKGQFKVGIQARDDFPTTPGQRLFSYAVPIEGDLTIVGPPLLRHGGSTPEFQAKYADGVLLRKHATGAEIGFWWLKSEGDHEYFLVGTEREYGAWRSEELRRPERQRRPAAADDGGGGGKGHGRRGH